MRRRRRELGWLHTVESTRRLYRLVESGRATIQKVTIAGEIRRQVAYKMSDRHKHLVVVGRFYPSSKTCSSCGAVKAKLPLHVRVYECETCGMSLDRDVNAAINIAREGLRLLEHQQHDHDQHQVAGLRPETRNADPRPRKTSKAQAALAAVA